MYIHAALAWYLQSAFQNGAVFKYWPAPKQLLHPAMIVLASFPAAQLRTHNLLHCRYLTLAAFSLLTRQDA
jgi:hypothetical protein